MEKEKEKQCGVCKIPSFERNNYYFGKLMTVKDFFAEQCYFNEKRWLMNRMISGWGVVCGLEVVRDERDPKKIIVKPGLAIDCCGREILVCENQEVPLIPEEFECHKEQTEESKQKRLVICLEFRECKAEPINLPPIACDQKDKCEFNRIRDSFKICLRPAAEVDLEDPYGKICPLENKNKTVHEYLCERFRKGCPECPERPCLVLAEITIAPSSDPDKQNDISIDIDQCSKRKFVYSNPLLYDLFNCFHGDLPHVVNINWRENGANIPWEKFESGIYRRGVQVIFDKKMRGETINANTFLFLVKMEDADTGNYGYDQVPGTVSYNENTLTATFKIESQWLIDVYFGFSRIREKGGEFMVILKSDFILSAKEDGKPARALDGNFIGGKLPSGNGTQGGDFVSWFSVGPKQGQAGKEKITKKR